VTRQIALRSATVDDAALIARLHTESWQASYRGILPDAYLQNEASAERAAYWQAAFDQGGYGCIRIATAGSEPVAFIALKYGSDPDYDAVIEHLHVLPGHKRQGLGRRLMAKAVDALLQEAMTSVCLRVFEDNIAAIAFYERLGGITDDFGTDQLAGSNAPDRRIGWRDLAALKAACEEKP
jgi:ribosomal protein S18 acetylase RimI-like enzyme